MEESYWGFFILLAFLYCSLNMCGSGYFFWFEETGIFLMNRPLLGYSMRRKQTALAATSNQKRCRNALKINYSQIKITSDRKTKTGKTTVDCAMVLRVQVRVETVNRRDEGRSQ